MVRMLSKAHWFGSATPEWKLLTAVPVVGEGGGAALTGAVLALLAAELTETVTEPTDTAADRTWTTTGLVRTAAGRSRTAAGCRCDGQAVAGLALNAVRRRTVIPISGHATTGIGTNAAAEDVPKHRT